MGIEEIIIQIGLQWLALTKILQCDGYLEAHKEEEAAGRQVSGSADEIRWEIKKRLVDRCGGLKFVERFVCWTDF